MKDKGKMTWEEFHEAMRKSGNVKIALETIQKYRDWYFEDRKRTGKKLRSAI